MDLDKEMVGIIRIRNNINCVYLIVVDMIFYFD